MRTYIVTIDETQFVSEPEAVFSAINGVKAIKLQPEPIKDPTGVLTRNLAIPGPPLTDEEMEILAWDMEHDTSEGIPLEAAFDEIKTELNQWRETRLK
jgi:hypothetical protein